MQVNNKHCQHVDGLDTITDAFGSKSVTNKGQIPEKTVNEISTELVPYLKHFKAIPKMADTKPNSHSTHLLSTESGD